MKKAIVHRNNVSFYRTSNSALAGDLFMSLIHICELAGANAFDSLTVRQRHAEVMRKNPSAGMLWNYQESLTKVESMSAS